MVMNILFRVDSSFDIGTGHVMRCLTLAQMLKEAGCTVSFAMKVCSGDLCDYAESQGFSVFRLFYDSYLTQAVDAQCTIEVIKQFKNPVDWCIVDHYQLDGWWERKIQKHVAKIMVIDDLANRPHDCHLLLDQNYYKTFQKRYDGLVPESCGLFLGPQYMILRPEFYKAKESLRNRNGHIQRLLVFFGGSDPTNETEKVLHALKELQFHPLQVDVVVGKANPRHAYIGEMCAQMGIRYHCQIDYLAKLMAQADFSLGAGGVTMWERCFLGLPSAVTVVAENQRQSTEDAAEYGAVWNLGWHGDIKVSDYADILNRALSSPDTLMHMSQKALRLMGNGRGYAVHPVVQAILEG
jgi:UDP-2,4-diacetamido-2,4,6-trideoxy-beta-L-altropyranose hydrolase